MTHKFNILNYSILNFNISENLKRLLLLIIILINSVVLKGQHSERKVYHLLENSSDSYSDNIKNIDSAISITINEKDFYFLSNIYFQKAAYIYSKRRYNEALKFYILSNDLSKKYNNEYIYYSSLYGIAIIQQQLSNITKSIKLLKECSEFFEQNRANETYNLAYISTLGRLSYLYVNKKIDSSEYYNNLELKYSKSLLDSSYSFKNKGIIEFYKKNYFNSISLINKSKKRIFYNNDLSWYMISLQYLGENYRELNDEEKSIIYYKEVISLFKEKKIVNKEIRLSFERMIEYYKNNNDKNSQLLYINDLLTYDSIFYETNKYLSMSYYEKYENAKLIKEKQKILKQNKNNKYLFTTIILVFLILIISLYYNNLKQKHKLTIYINNLIRDRDIKEKEKEKEKRYFEIDTNIEYKLKIFENSQLFLNPDFSLNDLSRELEYNRTIVSNYINNAKGKNFNQYINQLRIEYLIKKILSDDIIKLYTIEALAEFSGFNSRKTFSNAFYLNTGFRPSFFIKNFKK